MRGLIESLVDSEAQIGAIRARQAMLFTAITEVVELQTSRLPDAARKDREMPLREALSELAAGLRVTERTVQRRMSDGDDASSCASCGPAPRCPKGGSLPLTPRSSSRPAPRSTTTRLVRRSRCPRSTWPRSRPSADCARWCDRSPRRSSRSDIADRHREARKARGVFVRDLPDHMAELITVQPAVIVHGILDRLTQMAHEDQRASRPERAATTPAHADERTMDQRRADILADLLLCRRSGRAGRRTRGDQSARAGDGPGADAWRASTRRARRSPDTARSTRRPRGAWPQAPPAGTAS